MYKCNTRRQTATRLQAQNKLYKEMKMMKNEDEKAIKKLGDENENEDEKENVRQ